MLEQAWLREAGRTAATVLPAARRRKLAPLARLVSSCGEVSALPFPSSLCGPAQRTPSLLPAALNLSSPQPSPVPLWPPCL